MSIGGAKCGSQVVTNLQKDNTAGINGTLSLLAIRDNHYVDFTVTASTFTALTVKSDDSVTAQVDVTAVTGHIFLDGDNDDTTDAGKNDKITFGTGRIVHAKTILTLVTASGTLESDGTLTLAAGSGIAMWNSLTTIGF